MKKTKSFIVGLATILFGSFNVYAAVPAENFSSTMTASQNGNSNLGYIVSDKFVCYSCGYNSGKAIDFTSGGIGVYFQGENGWETGSFAGSTNNSNFTSSKYPMSALFTFATVDDTPNLEFNASNVNSRYLVGELSGNKLTKTILDSSGNSTGIIVSVEVDTSDAHKDKNYIKLNYTINNENDSSKTVHVATFNDVYLGDPDDATVNNDSCPDNTAFELVSAANVTKGFNAITGSKTDGKFMTVVLKENSGLLTDGGGTFSNWAGTRSFSEYDSTTHAATSYSNVYHNIFTDGGIPANATAYGDAEFAYSWVKDVPKGETTFSTLIGLGNLKPPTVDISKWNPSLNSDTKIINITTDNKSVEIGGIIRDECGMGTYTYTVNGEHTSDPIPYYTDGSFTTSYTTDVPTDWLSDQNENTFEVNVTSVACGPANAKETFNLPKDKESAKKTGIDSNYIALGVILLGGVALFIYSRKQNKFPQV